PSHGPMSMSPPPPRAPHAGSLFWSGSSVRYTVTVASPKPCVPQSASRAEVFPIAEKSAELPSHCPQHETSQTWTFVAFRPFEQTLTREPPPSPAKPRLGSTMRAVASSHPKL